MNRPTWNRRDVNRLALAALGGLVTGTYAGCGGKPKAQNQPPAPDSTAAPAGQEGGGEGSPRLLQDPHVCRGINTCRNKGKPGTTNQCAGQAHCATVAAHDCNGMNDCKGEGGCGENPGENQCKGQGSCAVPLSDKTWPKARKRFEELMAKAGKEFGEAPPKDET